jgi:hypothetical protein
MNPHRMTRACVHRAVIWCRCGLPADDAGECGAAPMTLSRGDTSFNWRILKLVSLRRSARRSVRVRDSESFRDS